MRSYVTHPAGAIAAIIADLGATAASTRLQRRRRSGVYQREIQKRREWRTLPRQELLGIQRVRLDELVALAREQSPFYRRRLQGLSLLSQFPILEKADLQEHIREIVIGSPRDLEQSHTGGTTGQSITVYNHVSSLQERFAILDAWWETHGYRFGENRIAWFSGRNLLWKTDTANRRFWRNNWWYRIRYYSTFHMSPENLGVYVDNLNAFRPQFLHGFPSAISELARFVHSERRSLTFQPAAVFATSETLNAEQRDIIESAFRCKVRDHYGASEGAPFILECTHGRFHLDVTSGVIEVVDERGRPAREGEMLVTCFFTRNTPIIRYRIGDSVTLSNDERCECGWDTPLADAIHGRRMDYIEIPGRGRIFNAQIGDCVKDVNSVRKFQVQLNEGRLQVYMVANRADFEAGDRETFLKKIAERMGPIPVDIHYVPDIPRAASGKHSMVRREPANAPR